MANPNPEAILATIKQSLTTGEVARSVDRGQLDQHLQDIEKLVGKLERMYIQHTAAARESGFKQGLQAAITYLDDGEESRPFAKMVREDLLEKR